MAVLDPRVTSALKEFPKASLPGGLRGCMRARLCRIVLAVVASVVISGDAIAGDIIRDGDRVVFLGDSNTFAGFYVTEIESQWLWQFPESRVELINLGLPSETACGLSEPDHPFPRPNVQERAERVMQKLQPDVLVICYGMNDGIYHPFSDERFAAYKEGIRKLIAWGKRSGARIVLLTPPPFDPQPLRKKGNLLPASADRFSWIKVYENYDAVMKRYAEWILQQDDVVDQVIDIRTPMVEYLRDRRKTDPDYAMSGDGVHFDRAGHRLIAEKFLRATGVEVQDVPQPFRDAVHRRQLVLRDSWLSYVGHKRPGVKAGLPREVADEKVRQMREELVSWAQQKS